MAKCIWVSITLTCHDSVPMLPYNGHQQKENFECYIKNVDLVGKVVLCFDILNFAKEIGLNVLTISLLISLK